MSPCTMTAHVGSSKEQCGTLEWISVDIKRTWPDRTLDVCGELIFKDFGDTHIASHMEHFDIRINSPEGNFAIKDIICTEDESICTLLKAKVRYKFTAQLMIKRYE